MAEAQKIAVRPRDIVGKKVKALRRAGRMPGVVAGGHADSTAVDMDAHAFELGYRRWGSTTLLALEGLGGGNISALIHGVARDPRTGRIVHVDFQRVSLTEKTHAEVPLHFTGESAAVKTHGAVLYHQMEHLTVEAFPQDMPRRIEVSLATLREIEDTIHVRDIAVDAAKLRVLTDANELVVKAMAARTEEVVAVKVAAPVAADGDGAAEEPAAGAKPTAGAKPAAGAKADKK